MLIDGVNLVEGSTIVNATIDSGTNFPNTPSTGELFFRTDDGKVYIYDGADWILTGADAPSYPENEIVFGTGTSISSDPMFNFNPITGSLQLNQTEVASPGSTNISGMTPSGAGPAGPILIAGGDGGPNGNGGALWLGGGAAGNTTGNVGGNINIEAGHGANSNDDGHGGYIQILSGYGGNNAGNGGILTIEAGSADSGNGGDLLINAGTGLTLGGNVLITSGDGSTAGNVTIQTGDGGEGTVGTITFKLGASITSATVIDNYWTFTDVPQVINETISLDNELTPKSYVDQKIEEKVSLAGDTMDSAANLVFTDGGEITGLPTTPSDSTSATSKAYVDNLVFSSTTWRNPIECPSFVDIVSAIPGSPIDYSSFIKFGGTQNETWGTLTNVSDYDILEYNGSDWERLGILDTNMRFLVAVERGTVGSGAYSVEMRAKDLVQYIGGDVNLASSWIKPHQTNYQGIIFSSTKIGSTPTGLTNDSTVYNASIRVNNTTYPITVVGSAAQTFDDLVIAINADLIGASASIVDGHMHITASNEEHTILISNGSAPNLWTSLLDFTEIRGANKGGTTVLTHNPGCYEYGHVYLYSTIGHEWVEIAGPGSIGAGVGLAYDGNVLKINLGAGIQELPSDEVGLDLYPNGGLMLTNDGINYSSASNAGLALTTTGIVYGTYKSVTVSEDGRIYSGTNPTTLTGYGITNAAEINPSSPKDGDVRVTGSIIDIYANGAWRQVFPAVYS